MNIDNIHDALNLLDDDMVETVDKLRNEKAQIIKMHRKNIWVRWVSVAACLCIVAVSVYVTDGFGLMLFKAESNDAAQMEVESESVSMENKSDITDDSEGANSTETNKDYITGESTVEVPSVLVEIVSWQENGFVGTIAGIVDTEKYAVGTTVTVKFKETVDSTDFPEGSVVCVQFSAEETETDAEIILYVEQISLEETE